MFFSAKAILEFFQIFYSNFNLVHNARKNYTLMLTIFFDFVEIQLKNEPKIIEKC